MVTCAETFISTLKARELKFNTREFDDGTVMVAVPFDGRTTNVLFAADDDGKHVALRTMFESCPQDRIADVLLVCNSLNCQYRWLKFCIDSDNDIMVEDDAIVTPETAGDECFELVIRTANILKDVKPTIMRAIYG